MTPRSSHTPSTALAPAAARVPALPGFVAGASPLRSRRSYRASVHGFSIIEILVAIILIGILVAILVPVIANRADDARLARAGQDAENLANAQDRLYTDVGYLARLYVLNDTIGGDTPPTPFSRPGGATDPNDIIDGVRDHAVAGELYDNPTNIFVDPRGGVGGEGIVISGSTATSLLNSLQTNETNFNWHGPYLNWQADNNYTVSGITGPDGIPDDAWGNNFLLFVRGGLVKEVDARWDTDRTGEGTVVDTITINGQTFSTERFDRAAIVSFGPNGLPGDGSGPGNVSGGQIGQGDDVVRKFGP